MSKAGLVYLAVPKTGTTAVESALRGHADLIFSHRLKHITARRYRKRIAPFLSDQLGMELETVAVIRHPVEQLRSWYRYRARDGAVTAEKSTANMSFDAFVEGIIAPTPPPFAKIGTQFRFVTGPRGRLIVDHLFGYETPDLFKQFLAERLGGEIAFARRNVSPPIEAPLSPRVEADFRAAHSQGFALYDRLIKAGGYLGTRTKARAA